MIHGDGDTIDGFADIVIVNYEVLDRHVGWLGDFGFRGMVVDEAHFIKNKTSQRSQHVLALSERIRSRTARPLLMALTGTPLINDIEDFRAIWQFLGWIDDDEAARRADDALEETGLTPADPGFYPAARQCVIDLGIVRRRKVDVAADIPARRIADLPVELDGPAGRSIRAAERDLARRMVARYETALANRSLRRRRRGHRPRPRAPGGQVGAEGRDHVEDRRERVQHDATHRPGEGRPRRRLRGAAGAQRRQGRLLRQARRRDGRRRGDLRQAAGSASPRSAATRRPRCGRRTSTPSSNDPDVAIAVCSLTAAGVGLNLQVASNIVLAELSWTDAEQTQAIDRSHRIGQTEPVTAWRIIAAQTIDARIAELIDSKAGLAARALDGSDEEVSSSADVQLEALVALLTDALAGVFRTWRRPGFLTVRIPRRDRGRGDSQRPGQAWCKGGRCASPHGR